MRKSTIYIVFLFVFVMLLSTSNVGYCQFTWPSMAHVDAYTTKLDDASYNRLLDQWDEASMTEKILITDLHALALRSGGLCSTALLEQCYQRAQQATQRLLGIRLGQANPLTEANRASLIQETQAELSTFKQTALSNQAVQEPSLSELTNRYQGQIGPGPEQVYDSPALFQNLLTEWSPFGKSISDLEAILGYSGQRLSSEETRFWAGIDDTTAYLYNFDNGFSGSAFVFLLDDNSIRSLIIRSSE